MLEAKKEAFMDPRVFEGRFGLEKENLRVTMSGQLARTPHPFDEDPHISKDFCESQTEMITEVCKSTEELYKAIVSLNKKVSDKIAERGEFLWNSSNPPEGIDTENVPVAKFSGKDAAKEDYRRYLLGKYGPDRMLLSGIHYNFSFGDSFMEMLGGDKDQIYLRLAADSLRYAWFVVYLMSASPRADKASVRCSEEGYWNDFIPILDYSSLDAYVDGIDKYVDEGKLDSISELYLPVRIKPRGINSAENLRTGIDHIELRMIDINPLCPVGIAREDLYFLHLLLIYLALKGDGQCTERMQEMAVDNMKKAALLDDSSVWIARDEVIFLPIREAALEMLSLMEMFFEETGNAHVMQILEYQKSKLLKRNGRYSEKISAMKRGKKKCANYSQSVQITA